MLSSGTNILSMSKFQKKWTFFDASPYLAIVLLFLALIGATIIDMVYN